MINKNAEAIKTNIENGTYFDPYIDSGLQNKMYTLRASYKTWNFTGEVIADIHLTNLSINASKAEKKAFELTGKKLSADFIVNKITRDKETDGSVLAFGKYKGQTVADVAESNPDYLVFIVENNYIPAKHKANRAAIIAAMGERLNQATGITLNFGKYEGQTLKHIAQIDPNYIADLVEAGEASLPIPARRIFVDMIKAVDSTLTARRLEREQIAA